MRFAVGIGAALPRRTTLTASYVHSTHYEHDLVSIFLVMVWPVRLWFSSRIIPC